MPNVFSCRVAAPVIMLMVGGVCSAMAGAGDYEFQLVKPEVVQGSGVLVAVRLFDRRSGKGVPDAVIFATRLDMEPDGMEAMTTELEPVLATEPGTYQFRADVTMEGNWRLSLAAKVQGEAETVQARLPVRALP